MRYIDSVRRAGRSLRSAKARTLLTSLAIAVGAFTLTAALAAGTGARQYANDLIKSNVDPQSLFVAKDESLFSGGGKTGVGLKEYSENEAQLGQRTFKALNADDIAKIKATDGVASVTPTYLVNAQYVTFEGKSTKYTTDITAYDSSVRADVAAGNLPTLDTQLGANEAVVPESYANTLGVKPAELVGKKVTLHVIKSTTPPSQQDIQKAFVGGGTSAVQQLLARESKDVSFTIRAVSAASSTTLTASSAVFISDQAAKDLSDYITAGTDQYEKYITATVQAKKGVDPATVKQRLESKGLVAKTAQDLQNLLFTIVNVIQGIVLVFGVLALIASVFGIINTQYIAVLERTREIGLMKALGMRGRHVSRLFQLEAAWIGLLGGVLGSALAILVGTLLNPWISKTIGIGEHHILVFEPLTVLALMLALMLIATLAGYFPARKAAKLDPIEALRTE